MEGLKGHLRSLPDVFLLSQMSIWLTVACHVDGVYAACRQMTERYSKYGMSNLSFFPVPTFTMDMIEELRCCSFDICHF